MKPTFLISIFFAFLSAAQPVHAQNTFVVDTWYDHYDLNPGDGNCYTILGECTLRAAIEEANALPNTGGPDVILFNDIPILAWFAMITVQDTLPLITDPIVIDGTTAGGEVIINGEDISGPGNLTGLWLVAGSSGSTIRGLSIGNFYFQGIAIDSNDNVIEKNYVGVLQDGTDYGNAQGIRVSGNRNRVGGAGNASHFSGLGKGNVVGFNGGNGISNYGDDNLIRRNFVGMSPTGENIGNGAAGIVVYNGDQTIIGGPLRRYGNRIGFNGDEGVLLYENSNAITVRNNYIGVDNDGNDRGNGDSGIHIYKSSNHTIGGINDRGNVIGFNADGIYLEESEGNTIQGNFIGVDRDGNDVGNVGAGIYMGGAFAVSNNKIGYATDATIPQNTPKGNAIAHNEGAGVVIAYAFSEFNVMRGNTMYDNGEIGIDLANDGPTINDSLDLDFGANERQNYPDIVRAFYRPGSDEIAIEFSVSSDIYRSTYPLTIDAYLADDPTSAEGKTHIGSLSYAAPDVIERFELAASSIDWSADDVVVLTATDAEGNTSEFSPASGELGDASTAMHAPIDLLDDSARNERTPSMVSHSNENAGSAPPSNSMGAQWIASLRGPYPNPFNPRTAFTLSVPEPAQTRITVHDMLGRQVALLHDGSLASGIAHTFSFDGSNMASGTYLLRIHAGQYVETHRLMLLK